MNLKLAVIALLGIVVATQANAQSEFDPSFRAAYWTSDRLANADGDVVNFELWSRAKLGAGPFTIKVEAFGSTNPIGVGAADADLREASISFDAGPVRIIAGRRLFVWGRVDRLNPTDVVGARDWRRLVEDEAENRLGIASVTGEVNLAGGVLAASWLPEFRAVRLPQDLAAQSGLTVADATLRDESAQFAVRYDRYSSRFDWSLSYARILDRNPWLDLSADAGGAPVLLLRHPRMTMIGADAATTIGRYAIRAEGARYFFDEGELGASARRIPQWSFALGADRTFPGQLNINVQGLLRRSGALETTPFGAFAQVEARNAVIELSHEKTVAGGLIRLRKPFFNDRASAEVMAAFISSGGAYAQFRASYAIDDGVRAFVSGERFSGESQEFFGRLNENSLIVAGIRAGF